MAPEFMSGSYQQYKNDTSAFTTWLGRAAAACGYKSQAKKVPEDVPAPDPKPDVLEETPSTRSAAPVSSQRLKGKARKQVKQAQAQASRAGESKGHIPSENVRTVTHEVTTHDLLAQIDAVSQSKVGIRMSPPIKRLLQRAVDARQRCSLWYESTKPQYVDGGGHRHFITILQHALTTLASDEPDHTASTPAPRTSKLGKKTLSKNNASLELR